MEKMDKILNNKIDNICRICLKECGIMLPIFKKHGVKMKENLSLADKISSIAEVQINKGDGLPQLICRPCSIQIEKFYDFRDLVKISDRTLRFSLEKNISKSANSEYFKNFIGDNFSDAQLNQTSFDHESIVSDSGDDMEVVWKICNNVNKDESETMGCDESILEDFHTYDDNEQEFKGILKPPEKCSSDLTMRKTKVQRLSKCTECNECFRDSRELALHLHTHVKKNEENNKNVVETKCELCFEQFSSLENLKIHIQDHFCDTRITDSENNIKSGKINYQRNDEYHCSQCKKEFLTAEECSEHIKKHKVNKLYVCGICSKVFTRNSSRKRHELNHVDKTFKCRQCGKAFQKKTELRYHANCHVVLQPTCEVCLKTFQNRQSLKHHMKRHTGESAHMCKICGKNYFSNSELHRHTQIHLGRRDFPCLLCNRSFFSKPELTRHGKYHRGDKKFKCQICSKAYFESGHLKVHHRIHTGERPFICEVCAKAFISKSKLDRHQKIHLRSSLKEK